MRLSPLPPPYAASDDTRPSTQSKTDATETIVAFNSLLDAATSTDAARQLARTIVAAGWSERAWVGLFESGQLRCRADSAIDGKPAASDPLTELVEGAMREAVEQALPLRWPPADGDVAVDDGLLVEQRLLHRGLTLPIATFPLGGAGEPVGALVLLRAAPFTRAELQRRSDVLQPLAPAFGWIGRAAEPWHGRLRRDLGAALDAWRDSEPGRRAVGLAALFAALALLALPLDDAVGGRARIEGGAQRVLSAPADGFVKAALARPGDHVKAGQPLLELVDGDLKLERERWSSQIAQHENAYAAAMARADRVGAATAMARIGEARAGLALVDTQLERGRVVAPFDALVIEGDWLQSVGAPVRQGDRLLTIAGDGPLRVVVEVDETDIAALRVGQHGSLALSALPWDRVPIQVDRIAPLAHASDGRNVFDVEGRLLGEREGLRPGLLGRAEIVVGRSPWLPAWLERAAMRVRVAWWRWWG